MVGDTVRNFIESRSYLDLLFVWIGYSIGWFINIYFGQFLSKANVPCRIHIESGLFVGAFCVAAKTYFPPPIFSLVITLTLAFVFYRVSGIRWIRSMAIIIMLNILVGIGDKIIIIPLLKTPIGEFILNNSAGLALGTLLEEVFPAIFILGVMIWRSRKRRYLIKWP